MLEMAVGKIHFQLHDRGSDWWVIVFGFLF